MIQVFFLAAAALAQAPAAASPDSYVLRVAAAVDRVGLDCEAMRGPAAEAATRLVNGGKLWVGGDPAFASELSGRAGGIMLTAPLGEASPAAQDVVLFSVATGAAISDVVKQSGAFIIAFGDGAQDGAAAQFSGYAADYHISPALASIIPAWIFTGVLIGQCAVAGKLPVTYETIGLPGGFPRIQQYQAQGKFWIDAPSGERERTGFVDTGQRYAGKVVAILNRVEREDRALLDRAGEWAGSTLKRGKTVYMYAMGHFVPDELAKSEIGKRFKIATWNSGLSGSETPKDEFSEGDLAFHIGYQHPPYGLYERARPSGANIVYVDLLQHRDWKDDPHVLWIDPMWPWDDAVVLTPGYDIPMLPPSGIVNCAIAWEIYRLATRG